MSGRGRFAGALAIVALGAGHARAESAPPQGDRVGLATPLSSTAIGVERASISYALQRDLDRAAVTAVYELENPGEVAASTDVAVPYVHVGEQPRRDEAAGDDPGKLDVLVEIDGMPVAAHESSLAMLLAPKLGAFLLEHPDVARALAGSMGNTVAAPETDPQTPPQTPPQTHPQTHQGAADEPAQVRRLVEAAGGRCSEGCPHLVAWQKALAQSADPEKPPDDELLVAAAREALPALVDALTAPWAARDKVRFALFELDLPPRACRTVATHFDQRAEIQRGARAAPLFGYGVRLASARAWANFGRVDVSVATPQDTLLASPRHLDAEAEGYSMSLDAGFAREARETEGLGFQAMPLGGLWFGMTETRDYWRIAIAVAVLIAAAVGAAAGPIWSRDQGVSTMGATPPSPRSAMLRLGVGLATAAPLAIVCAFAAVTLLLAFGPLHALGYHGVARRIVALLLASGLLASLVSALTGGRVAARGEEPARIERSRAAPGEHR